MKTTFKIIVLLFCLTAFCCGKKKEKEKECVGSGTLENIKDTVLITGFDNQTIIAGLLSAAINGDTSIADKAESKWETSESMVITKEKTFNQFISKIKSANNPAFNNVEQIENIKPDFSVNSIIIIPYVRIPTYVSDPKFKIFYSLSFELSIDSVEKTVNINITTKDNYKGEKVTKLTALLITPKINLSYTVKSKLNRTNCMKRIL